MTFVGIIETFLRFIYRSVKPGGYAAAWVSEVLSFYRDIFFFDCCARWKIVGARERSELIRSSEGTKYDGKIGKASI